jgi:hypothetical protein
MEQRGEVEATCNDTSDVWENKYVFFSKTQSSFKVRYAYIRPEEWQSRFELNS